ERVSARVPSRAFLTFGRTGECWSGFFIRQRNAVASPSAAAMPQSWIIKRQTTGNGVVQLVSCGPFCTIRNCTADLVVHFMNSLAKPSIVSRMATLVSELRPDSCIVAEVRPSPNHSERRGNVLPDMIVLHYTGTRDNEAALRHLCSP